MIGRVALVALLALSACKKKENAVTESGSGEKATGEKATGEKAADTPKPSGWSKQTGPGFSVSAPKAATVENVAPEDPRDHPYVRHTFYKGDQGQYMTVDVYDLEAGANMSREITTLRDRIGYRAQGINGENFIRGGEDEPVGRDIVYGYREGGGSSLSGRSLILAKGTRMFEARYHLVEERESEGDAFIDSFAMD